MPARWREILAYLLALLGAPLVIATLGFWMLLIPLFAIYFGGIPYLVLAGPGFWLALRRVPPNPLYFAGIGFALNLLSPAVYLAIFYVQGMALEFAAFQVFWIYGALFSALWGATFALLFRGFSYLLHPHTGESLLELAA